MFCATPRTGVEISAWRKCARLLLPAPRAVFRAAGGSFRRAVGEAMHALILIVPAGLPVPVVATATYSRDRTGSGAFGSWPGHDTAVDRSDPVGLEGARVSAGMFNLADEPLAADTSDPSATDGPISARRGRSRFLTLNRRF